MSPSLRFVTFCFLILCCLESASFLRILSSGRCNGEDPGQGEMRLVSKIAFGSCADQNNPCPIWGTIADYEPDLMLLLGDTVYADLENGRLKPSTPERIALAYQQLDAVAEFQRLRQRVPLMGTWDDHDYGNNDAGVEWEHKDAAARLFHDFFKTAEDSPRRSQKGIYQSHVFGPPGKRVQILLLDTRYFRSQLTKGDTPLPGFRARPYVQADGPDVTMLGEAQWKWLETQLEVPAEVRLLVSSIQVVSDEHPFEKWGTMPSERERLYALLRKTRASGVVVLSGDRHLGEISQDATAIGYPLYDVTASGLNQATLRWRPTEPNRARVAALPFGNHFGAVEIDWLAADPEVRLQLRHEDGQIAVQSRIPLSLLQAPPASPPLPSGVSGPEQAIAMSEGTQATIQFRVAGGRMLGNRSRLLLNSQEDFRNLRNMTVVVNPSALTGRYSDAELKTFLGKTIRATGRISLYNGSKQMEIDSAERLEIVEGP